MQHSGGSHVHLVAEYLQGADERPALVAVARPHQASAGEARLGREPHHNVCIDRVECAPHCAASLRPFLHCHTAFRLTGEPDELA